MCTWYISLVTTSSSSSSVPARRAMRHYRVRHRARAEAEQTLSPSVDRWCPTGRTEPSPWVSPASRVLRDLPAPTLPGVTSSISGRRVTGSPEASIPRIGPSSCSQPTRQYNDHCQSTASLPSGRGISPPGTNISRGRATPGPAKSIILIGFLPAGGFREGSRMLQGSTAHYTHTCRVQHACNKTAHASSAACIRADVLQRSRARMKSHMLRPLNM